MGKDVLFFYWTCTCLDLVPAPMPVSGDIIKMVAWKDEMTRALDMMIQLLN